MKQIGLIVLVLSLIGAGIAYYDLNYVRVNDATAVQTETKVNDPHAGLFEDSF